jgi:peptide/nickel transport system permease protein
VINKVLAKSRRRPTLVAGLFIVAVFYFIAIFAGFLAPYDYREQTRSMPSAPPSTLHFRDAEGTFHTRPFIYKQRLVDARNIVYEEDTSREFPTELFSRGHLFGVAGEEAPHANLLGTDQLGRDRFSRLLFAIRFSLLVSPIGTILACLIGVIFGALSGYARSTLDTIMMGVADTMISLPTLILILAARAAFPIELPPMSAAALLIMIFALTGWAEIARLARGLVVATRQREFVLAARAGGVAETRILFRHILPNVASPLLIQATLLLPVFLLAEVALSFLGIGLQEPEPSLGNMLSASGDLTQLSAAPFVILSPAIAIFFFVLGIRLIAWHSSPRS